MSDFNINFFTLDVFPPLKNKKRIRNWIFQLIYFEKKHLNYVYINIVFCDDQYLLNLNKQFLKKDTFTDILSFDYSQKNTLEGDMFISIDRIKENAVKYSQKPEIELLRIIAHGILHLCGYQDKVKDDKILMKAKENFYLSVLNKAILDNDKKLV